MREECRWINRWREWWKVIWKQNKLFLESYIPTSVIPTNKCHPDSSCWRVKGQRTTRKGRRRLTIWHFVCQDTIVNMLLRFVMYKLVIEVIKRIDWRRWVNLCNQTKIWGECFTMDVKHSPQILVWLQRLTRLRQSILLITSIASLYITNLSNILTIVSWQTKCQNVNLLLPFLVVLCLLILPQGELGWHLLVCMIPEASYLVFKSFHLSLQRLIHWHSFFILSSFNSN